MFGMLVGGTSKELLKGWRYVGGKSGLDSADRSQRLL